MIHETMQLLLQIFYWLWLLVLHKILCSSLCYIHYCSVFDYNTKQAELRTDQLHQPIRQLTEVSNILLPIDASTELQIAQVDFT